MADVAWAPGAAIAAGEHQWPIRVYYEDTDSSGLVYHASYLRFAERARTEMIRCLDVEHHALKERFGIVFAVRRCVVDYLAPARLDDRLDVRTRIVQVGGASLGLEQRIFRGQLLLVRIEVRLALLSPALRPTRLPATLLEALAPRRSEPAPDG